MAKTGRRSHWKKVLFAWFVSIAILVLLSCKTDIRLRHIFDILKQVDPVRLTGIFLLSAVIHILLGGYKWFVVLRGIGCETTFLETLFVRMGSDPIRFVMPFKTGELSNMLYYSRTGKLPFAESASWVLFDKALNFLGTLIWFGVGVLLIGQVPDEIRWPVLAAGGGLVVMLLFPALARVPVMIAERVHGKLGRVMRHLLVTFERIKPARRLYLVCLATVFQLRPLIVCYLLFSVFLQPVFKSMPTPPEMLAKGSVAVVAGNMIGTVHGMGPREAALVVMFRGHLDEKGVGSESQPGDGLPPGSVRPPADKSIAPPMPAELRRVAPSVRHESTREGRKLVGFEAPLIVIGILMAVAIHLVPAVCGLPLMAGLLTAIEEGRASLRRESRDEDDDEADAPPDDGETA